MGRRNPAFSVSEKKGFLTGYGEYVMKRE